MKKLVLVLSIVFAFSFGTRVMAQGLTDDVIFNAHLEEVLIVTVETGGIQDIVFDEAEDYTNGVTEAGLEIDPGFSDVSVESTGNWNMTIECPDFTGVGGVIPINNLGVWIENNGTFNGGESTWTCISAATAQALTDAAAPIISNGTGNAGDIDENFFQFHWLMGTMQGSMNTTSMFDQLQNNDFELGDYTTTAILTVAPAP